MLLTIKIFAAYKDSVPLFEHEYLLDCGFKDFEQEVTEDTETSEAKIAAKSSSDTLFPPFPPVQKDFGCGRRPPWVIREITGVLHRLS